MKEKMRPNYKTVNNLHYDPNVCIIMIKSEEGVKLPKSPLVEIQQVNHLQALQLIRMLNKVF